MLEDGLNDVWLQEADDVRTALALRAYSVPTEESLRARVAVS